MSKIAAILLNYNDAQQTVRAAQRLSEMPMIDRIILVDNASTDNSRAVLKACVARPGSRMTLIENPKNGGYGYGNNRGVQAAAGLGCDRALIVNPDVIVTEEAIGKLSQALNEPDVAAAGAGMLGKPLTDCAWPLLGFEEELLFNGPVTKRLFHSRVNYPKKLLGLPAIPVGAVHGSLFLVKIPDFMKAGGFDEELFLFMEEKALGQRLARIGKKIVLTDAKYQHAGSGTMKKQGLSAVDRQKERQKSERIYYQKYLNAGPEQMERVRLQQAIVLLETEIAAKMKLL